LKHYPSGHIQKEKKIPKPNIKLTHILTNTHTLMHTQHFSGQFNACLDTHPYTGCGLSLQLQLSLPSNLVTASFGPCPHNLPHTHHCHSTHTMQACWWKAAPFKLSRASVVGKQNKEENPPERLQNYCD